MLTFRFVPKSFSLGNRLFDFSEDVPFLVGILNVTPDSFSDGGLYLSPQQAWLQALELQKQGADLIDVGAESTRPGARPISAQEQIDRLGPVLERLHQSIQLPLSIDTRLAAVADFAVRNGVALVNDVSGFCWDESMLDFLSRSQIPAVLMHSFGNPENMRELAADFGGMKELLHFFENKLELCKRAGIQTERLILDPGIGFGKTPQHNAQILGCLRELSQWGLPLLVGSSRKSFLNFYFGEGSDPKRELGTELSHLLAMLGGVHFLRVHNVALARKTKRFLEDARQSWAAD